MNNLADFHWKMAPYEWIIVAAILWELAWKAIAMWRAARNKQLAWYICIVVFNTLGILPIIYLLLNRNNKKDSPE